MNVISALETINKNHHEAKLHEFPITLPSLWISSIKVPYPMSERDFDFFYDAIGNLKEALVRKEEAP